MHLVAQLTMLQILAIGLIEYSLLYSYQCSISPYVIKLLILVLFQLWVGPGSKVAEEKRFFDTHLAPFYRIEQVLQYSTHVFLYFLLPVLFPCALILVFTNILFQMLVLEIENQFPVSYHQQNNFSLLFFSVSSEPTYISYAFPFHHKNLP